MHSLCLNSVTLEEQNLRHIARWKWLSWSFPDGWKQKSQAQQTNTEARPNWINKPAGNLQGTSQSRSDFSQLSSQIWRKRYRKHWPTLISSFLKVAGLGRRILSRKGAKVLFVSVLYPIHNYFSKDFQFQILNTYKNLSKQWWKQSHETKNYSTSIEFLRPRFLPGK